jgi:5-methylcytosine-specific restriction protein A
LLLFTNTAAGLRFEGEMVYEGHHIERAPDRTGADRNAIVFELRPLEAIEEVVEAEDSLPTAPLEDLRQRAFTAAEVPSQPSTQGMRNVYQRSRDVRIYVLARANGICEGCGSPAPFLRGDGTPYLEPHHLRRVSDGGPDHPAHVIALCPNCHRRVHAGADGQSYNATLIHAMSRIER